MVDTTRRCRWTPPFFALRISCSAYGRRALALVSVVTIASDAKKCAQRLAIISRWCWGLCPKRGPFLGRPGIALLLDPQRQAALVELLDDFLKRLLAEVRDGEQVVFGLLDELTDA